MANYEFVEITCFDEDLLESLRDKYYKESKIIETQEFTTHSFFIENIEGETKTDLFYITESEEFRDIPVFINASLESQWHQRIYEAKILNGCYELNNIKIQYSTSFYNKANLPRQQKEELEVKIINQVENFYREIDKIYKDDKGFIKIEDYPDKEIIVKFEVDGFKVQASKMGSEIDIQGVQRLPETEITREEVRKSVGLSKQDMQLFPF